MAGWYFPKICLFDYKHSNLFIQLSTIYFIYRWLFQAKVGSGKEVEHSLHQLRGRDADVSAESAEIQVCFINISYFNIINILSL